MSEELKKVLEEHKEEYIQYLQDLVRIDTQDIGHGILGGREKNGQEYLIRLMQKTNADQIEKEDLKEDSINKCHLQYHEGNLGHRYEDRYNVYATYKGEGGKSLLFNGHMDTMPPGDPELWDPDPFEAVIKDERLYGLGSADMKSGLLASLLAVKLIQDAGKKLPGDVMIASVCDEEGGGNGSIMAAMNGKKADGVVVCEGTSDQLILAHMGFVFFDIKVKGKANHSGAKWLGVSAIEKMMKIMRELEDLEHTWLLKYKHRLLPAPNLNVGVIQGGTAGSTVAGECDIKICVHYLPDVMTHDQIVEEVTDAIERVSESDKWLREHKPEMKVYQAGGAFEMDQNAPFVQTFQKAYENAMGKTVEIVGSPAGCDSRIWKNIAGCPTIQFGPGNLEQCHSPNEYVELQAFFESILVYAELMLEWGR